MVFDNKKLYSRLKELRGKISQKEAAGKCGLSQQGWARYEHGGAMPGAEAIFKICSAFNVSADWLIGLSDFKERGSVQSMTISNSPASLINSHNNCSKDCSECPLMIAATNLMVSIPETLKRRE